ncbi:hypothetical protein Lesp02_30800 [Lentzea sp. NBRC 105346]|uniref:hypothetical protein n=1 Tax=Lentzea sp. NBRC 105346 TaxID=3032205 RepID=UPI0024A58F49|nr:hypothetical protein [Lentzea sp. NBRC 105346]GLZ30891.1 hypothetical protein Lesp02_30800 [Lentzea sp. NBRC 105346]
MRTLDNRPGEHSYPQARKYSTTEFCGHGDRAHESANRQKDLPRGRIDDGLKPVLAAVELALFLGSRIRACSWTASGRSFHDGPPPLNWQGQAARIALCVGAVAWFEVGKM